MGLTFTDIFCGAGGSSIGLTNAGFELKLAANHWDRAVANGSGHALVQAEPFVAMLRRNGTATGISEPLATLAAGGNHHALVVPYRRGTRPATTDEPLHTLATRDSAALIRPTVQVDDCYFRMLKPREHLRGQRFPDSYTVTGNKGEQTMQAGNAVSANVAQWLGTQLATALGGAR